MVSLNQAFKIIASMYRTLNRQIVELDDQIEELETIIYAPVTGDLSRVISSKTTKTGKTNSKVALFSKLDKFVEMRTFKRDITDEIERLVSLSQQYIRPYIWEVYLNGGFIPKVADKIGMSESKFKHNLNDEINECIVPECQRLYELCLKDRYTAATFKKKADTDLVRIIRFYENKKKEKKEEHNVKEEKPQQKKGTE